LDEYLQATLVSIEPGGLRLQINLTPGVAVAQKVLALIDRDHDGMISTNEIAAYAETLKRDLVLRLDHRPGELKLLDFYCPTPDELGSGCGIIQFEFAAKLGPFRPGAHTIGFQNRHLPAVSVYLLNAAQPRSKSLQIVAQKRNENQSAGEIRF